ncbi:hypothetical protein [Streptomyces sp. WMMB 322]|uniref:hypothetical protein n=1 Tax=Streptomyces sp. WMMB 322 TaxID=1286821 RepID=UPI0006E42864|nr:hypothetical protein [Streptomyces sp. WMMB 322]SCK22563.1 hypothetical protein H180DRAFT_01665 [Streptomyces sp. WMMB 322]
MRAGAFVYPWDVVGDPDAPRRLAALGISQVTLASAYHSVRALTPRHPRHRIVTARHSAVLYPPGPDRWRGRRLRPYEQDWVDSGDPGGPYGEAARALSEAGLEVHSWVVMAHNSRLGEEHRRITVRNAYGDHYSWAPCIARPEVREYLVDLAAEAAVRPHTAGTELESCGWYGLAHLHAHDKTGGVRLSGAGQYLMSLCFCEVCRDGYASLGADPEELRSLVRGALEPAWSGAGAGARPSGAEQDREQDREGEWSRVRELLGPQTALLCASWRDAAARRLRREAVAAVREAAARTRTGGDFRVMLHADPAPHRLGANAGTAPADAVADADGVVIPCSGDAAGRSGAVGPFAAAATAGATGGAAKATGTGHGSGRAAGFTVAANFTVVSGMGGSPHSLAADAAHARELGAHELRLYHAGLAPDCDLAAVKEALRTLGEAGPPG